LNHFKKGNDFWKGMGTYLKSTTGWNNNGNDYFGFAGLLGGFGGTDCK